MAVRDRAPAEALGGRVPPLAFVLGASTSIQFGAALAATLFDDLGPGGASMMRLTFAALVLMLLWRPRLRGRGRADARLVVAFGLALGVMNLSFYEALARLPLGIAVTIELAGPIAVATALSRRPLDFVWVGLAATGIVLLADPFGAGGVDGLGLAFVLLAAVCWAAYILLSQRTGARFAGGEGLAVASLIAALVPLAPGIADAGGDLLHPGLLALGLCVAVLSSVIPYSLELEALRRMPANVFGVLQALEPLIATVAGFLILGQSLGGADLVAVAFVVAAAAGVSRSASIASVDG
jgi:inner membrane transporter RhtA